MSDDSSRRRVFALIGAVLLALFGAGTGVRTFLGDDEEPTDTGLDLTVDYSVTPDDPVSTPTPTPGGGGGSDGEPDSTGAGSPDGAAVPGTPAAGTETSTGDDDPWFGDDDDEDDGGGGDGGGGGGGGDEPTTASPTPSSELVASSIPPVSVTDVSPGDGGVVDLSLRLSGSPGRLWVRADASEFAERSVVESERSAGDTGPPGELQDHVQVRLWYDADGDGTDTGERVVYEGPLADLGSIAEWVALTDDCVSPGAHTVRFRWDVPTDAPNTIQTDGVAFSLGVAAEASDCR